MNEPYCGDFHDEYKSACGWCVEALRKGWHTLEEENTRLQIRAGEAEAQRKEAQTGRENVHAYCGVIEQERDALQARLDSIKEKPLVQAGG